MKDERVSLKISILSIGVDINARRRQTLSKVGFQKVAEVKSRT